MKKNNVCAMVFGLVLSVFCHDAYASDTWDFVSEQDGIATFTRQVEGSGYAFYKANTTIDATMAQVGAVFRDVLAYPKWMPNVKETKVLKQYNANDMDLYFVLNFPWPTTDRDTVLASRTVVDQSTGIVDIHTENYEEPCIPEKEGFVRIPKLLQTFTMTYLDNHHTEVSYTIFMDAGGRLPVLAVDMDMKKAPFKSLTNLKKVVQEATYQKADPFDATNLDITKIIMRLNLKKYVTDDDLIACVMQDTPAMERLFKNGHSEQVRKKNLAIIARVYVRSPEFISRIQNAQDKDVLAQLATDETLLDDLINQDNFVNLILSAGKSGMFENMVHDMAGMIKARNIISRQ